MLYAFPIIITLMLGYMFWHAGFSMRRARILKERSAKHLSKAAPAPSRPEGLR